MDPPQRHPGAAPPLSMAAENSASNKKSRRSPVPLLSRDIMLSQHRKDLFGDCALIEIIHLHDCLRGALKSLEEDVAALTQQISKDNRSGDSGDDVGKSDKEAMRPAGHRASVGSPRDSESPSADWSDLERRVAGRFKVIWSVFRAHSSAEDEFIWPALRSKMGGTADQQQQQQPPPPAPASSSAAAKSCSQKNTCGCGTVTTGLVQEEYEEDHADEERMFSEMDALLTQLRGLINSEVSLSSSPSGIAVPEQASAKPTASEAMANGGEVEANVVAHKISESTRVLSDHLMRHLEKEETQCMPLVVKHLSKAEIHDLVGNIMGKRSADTIAQIMTMAVQSLHENDRQEMIQYMKQSMQNTFFDRWLSASGWGQPRSTNRNDTSGEEVVTGSDSAGNHSQTSQPETTTAASSQTEKNELAEKRAAVETVAVAGKRARAASFGETIHAPSDATLPPTVVNSPVTTAAHRPVQVTSQAELEKLIRAIATNPALTPKEKNSTIQGLRDSVWKSNQREKQRRGEPTDSPPVVPVNVRTFADALPFLPQQQPQQQVASSLHNSIEGQQQRLRSGLPPSAYYKKKGDSSTVELVWKNEHGVVVDPEIPLFSASELAPTFHDGAAGAVLGCPHYARACKLRHPASGRLYTCRLCCDQARELPRGSQENEKLDRYAVSEVMCMICNTLQPADTDRCIHADCESRGKPFAKYFCRICHLYDDGTRPIFHCPYCNTCRLGLGLGIDFRHCMRCNACVSLDDKEHHCIPQKLQGSCPICHDTLFQSTEPLRGLKCGHVMHMTCFTQYRRTSYTCPLCMRSMEDMKDHFALLDAAIRMQPMPTSFLYTMSNIYCQDCGKTGQVQYHFVGQKCLHCSSYNTREMGRVQNAPSSL